VDHRRKPPLTEWQQFVAAYVALLVCALLWFLDRGCHVQAVHADVFSAIWLGIQAIAGWIGDAGTVIAATLEGVVAYLATAVSWLAGRVASILFSTGAVFAKVWEGLKVVWNDVLKPALVWIDDELKSLQQWLKDTFGPVFDFLKTVRTALLDLYTRFIKPILDVIDFLRALNRVLLAFHIKLLQGLDSVLQQIETRIEQPILWINAKLNEIWDALDLIVTADGLFQRLTLVRSMNRYVPDWLRIATNARDTGIPGDAQGTLQRASETQDAGSLVSDMQAYLAGGSNDTGNVIDAATSRAVDFFHSLV